MCVFVNIYDSQAVKIYGGYPKGESNDRSNDRKTVQ